MVGEVGAAMVVVVLVVSRHGVVAVVRVLAQSLTQLHSLVLAVCGIHGVI